MHTSILILTASVTAFAILLWRSEPTQLFVLTAGFLLFVTVADFFRREKQIAKPKRRLT